jgi:hypothetical protein
MPAVGAKRTRRPRSLMVCSSGRNRRNGFDPRAFSARHRGNVRSVRFYKEGHLGLAPRILGAPIDVDEPIDCVKRLVHAFEYLDGGSKRGMRFAHWAFPVRSVTQFHSRSAVSSSQIMDRDGALPATRAGRKLRLTGAEPLWSAQALTFGRAAG